MNANSSSSEFSIIVDEAPYSVKNKHWRMLRNLFHAACLLRRQEAEPVNDINSLVRSVEKIPTDIPYRNRREKEKFRNSLSQAVKAYRTEQSIFQIIERGNPEELVTLLKILTEDPKKYLRTPNSPDFLLNKKNSAGLTPLIISCKNGSLEYVKFLLDYGADWKIRTNFDNENALEAASRWGHYRIVKELMTKEWSKKEISAASKLACTEKVKNALKQKGSNKSCCFFR